MTTSSLDTTALQGLASITENYWRLSETVIPSMLIGPVRDHFEMLIQFLRGAPPQALYQPLIALAGETVQIAARLLFDMKDHQESAHYYDISIDLAQRAGNQALQVIGVVRKARDLLQYGYPKDAYALLQQAPPLSSQPGASVASAYRAAVEAKALSQLGETTACKQQLDQSAQWVEKIQPGDDPYWTSFDASLLGDFQGDCYIQLECYSDAQAVFQKAFQLSTASSPRHQSSVLVGLANTLMLHGQIEQSCLLASQALHITTQTQSWMILHYILGFRQKVEAWKNEPCVKSLDAQIAHVNASLF
jgi:tetratricopeptide (TPR) repeat protein